MVETLPKYTIDEIAFEEMSEDKAVTIFKQDGYTKYKKRKDRYKVLSKEGAWQKNPATMFMVFNKETHKPMGVIGFSIYNADLVLGAGLHVREGERRRGLAGHLVDKIIEEKGGRTLIAIFVSDEAFNAYTNRGFKPVEDIHLPDDIRNDIGEAEISSNYKGTLEKFLMLKDNWFLMLKRN
tara:strand:- start:270 stop:812 length:543 start_codon:yes stop_codon:yes gene_type:complete